MKIIRWVLASAFTIAASLTQAQELTLDQLIEQALKSNQDVQVSQLNERQTDAQINQVKANARPLVNLQGDYKRYLKIPGQVVPASAFGGPEGTYTALAFGLPYNLSTSLQVTQALYNPSLGLGLKIAKLNQNVSELQTVKTKEDVAYQVSTTYYNLQTVSAQMTFLRSNIASSDRLIKLTDLLYQNKLSQGIDVDRLRINRTQYQTQLESQQATYQQLVNMLKFLTGTPQADSLRVKTDIDQIADAPASLGDQPINRTDLLLLDRQKSINELSQQNTKAGFLPTVSAYGTGNSTVYAIGGDNSYIKNLPGYWFGLQLNWNIYDGSARKSKLLQQKIENQKYTIQLAQTRESVTMDVINGRNRFQVEQRNLDASRAQVGLAEKVYTQTQLQFKEGTASLTEVIQAENSLREAQNNYLTTLVNLRSAELDWKKATGNLITKQ